jgi:hypothetical protein
VSNKTLTNYPKRLQTVGNIYKPIKANIYIKRRKKMKVVIKNCDEFYNTFKYVEALNSQVKLMFDGEKVWLQVGNPSCTAIAEVKFPSTYFEEYECDTALTVGIHTKTFLSILKTTYKKKDVTLKMHASDSIDYLAITVTQEDALNGNVVCAYQMKLMEIVFEFMDIPNQDIHSQYKLSVNTLKKWKEFLFEKSPITFLPEESELTITCENELNHKLKLTDEISPSRWNEEMVTIINKKEEEEVVRRRKWKDICVGSVNTSLVFALLSFGKEVRIQFFLEDAPVECYVKLDEGVNIRVFIAPKIGEDEDDEDDEAVDEPKPVRAAKRKTMDEHGDEIQQLTQQKKAMTAR